MACHLISVSWQLSTVGQVVHPPPDLVEIGGVLSQEEPSCWALNQEPHSQEFSPTRSSLSQVTHT